LIGHGNLGDPAALPQGSMADKRYKAREPKGRQGVGSPHSTDEAE